MVMTSPLSLANRAADDSKKSATKRVLFIASSSPTLRSPVEISELRRYFATILTGESSAGALISPAVRPHPISNVESKHTGDPHFSHLRSGPRQSWQHSLVTVIAHVIQPNSRIKLDTHPYNRNKKTQAAKRAAPPLIPPRAGRDLSGR